MRRVDPRGCLRFGECNRPAKGTIQRLFTTRGREKLTQASNHRSALRAPHQPNSERGLQELPAGLLPCWNQTSHVFSRSPYNGDRFSLSALDQAVAGSLSTSETSLMSPAALRAS